jgi:hypothetical protein
MQITFAGVPTGIKILAANEEDVKAQLDRLAPDLALPREQMDVERPSGWPVPGLFGLEGLPVDLLRPDIDR